MPDTILGMVIEGKTLDRAAALTVGYWEACVEKKEYQKFDIGL